METKTSKEWYDSLYPNKELIIYDPDGWDRSNYDYSFNKEQITEQEFNKRILNSTVLAWLKPITKEPL